MNSRVWNFRAVFPYFALVLLAFFGHSCVKKVAATECPDGTFCSEGYRCVPSISGTGYTCAQASCGNGIVEAGEDCDDGDQNSLDPDACRPDCSFPACGGTPA